MKKILLFAAAMLAVAVVANAQVNLNFTDCVASGTVQTNKNIANSNTGATNLIGSIVAPAGIVALAGTEGVLDFQCASASLPGWWQFNQAGSCRLTSLTVQYNTAGASCIDYYSSIPGGALGGYQVTWAGNRARIKTVAAVDLSLVAGLNPGDEVYVFTIKIDQLKTVGTACPGYNEPICMVFNSLNLAQPAPYSNVLLSAPATQGFVTFNGGAIGAPGCPAATPTNKSSWGQVKALYR